MSWHLISINSGAPYLFGHFTDYGYLLLTKGNLKQMVGKCSIFCLLSRVKYISRFKSPECPNYSLILCIISYFYKERCSRKPKVSITTDAPAP